MLAAKLHNSDWKNFGFVFLKDFLTEEDKKSLCSWVDKFQHLPETPGKWMKYFEKTVSGERQLCRVENFLQYHEGFNRIARGAQTMALLKGLMGEKAALFKEKINYKLPGGGGFSPHQDYPAFLSFGQTYHITLMVAIDECTKDNGCLQVALGQAPRYKVLEQEPDKSIKKELAHKLHWTPVICQRGDVVLFDSFLPHYSEANHSKISRRVLFLTYNRLSDGGSLREQYYQDKRLKFPPECERVAGQDYSAGEALYNVANPILSEVKSGK